MLGPLLRYECLDPYCVMSARGATNECTRPDSVVGVRHHVRLVHLELQDADPNSYTPGYPRLTPELCVELR